MAVRLWLGDQAAETLYLSNVTLAARLLGVGPLLAGGARTDILVKVLERLTGLFWDRVCH